MWCWVGQVPASQTRNAEQVALGPNTDSAKRRPYAGSSRSIMGSSFLANKFLFPSKRPIRYFQLKKKKKGRNHAWEEFINSRQFSQFGVVSDANKKNLIKVT